MCFPFLNTTRVSTAAVTCCSRLGMDTRDPLMQDTRLILSPSGSNSSYPSRLFPSMLLVLYLFKSCRIQRNRTSWTRWPVWGADDSDSDLESSTLAIRLGHHSLSSYWDSNVRSMAEASIKNCTSVDKLVSGSMITARRNRE